MFYIDKYESLSLNYYAIQTISETDTHKGLVTRHISRLIVCFTIVHLAQGTVSTKQARSYDVNSYIVFTVYVKITKRSIAE